MRQIRFLKTGSPAEVVECIEVEEPWISSTDDVLVSIDLFPINPADLLTLQGFYPRVDSDAPTLGVEALGTVQAVGLDVTDLEPGDRVILLSGDNWVEKKVVKSSEAIRVPDGADRYRLATLKVNPATAALLLERFTELEPGDWIVQNAANSAVGRAVIQMAAARGLKTMNLVRRIDVAAELETLGGDVVMIEGEATLDRVLTATYGRAPRLALDGVGGASTDRLAACLEPGGTLVVYGAMSGEALTLNPGSLVFQDIHVRGFWLTRYLATAPRSEVVRLYDRVRDVLFRTPASQKVAALYPASEIKAAVTRAAGAESGSKVFVTFGADTID